MEKLSPLKIINHRRTTPWPKRIRRRNEQQQSTKQYTEKNRFISEKGINSFSTSSTRRGAHELYIMSDYLHWVMAQSLKIMMMDMCVTSMQWQILHTYDSFLH